MRGAPCAEPSWQTAQFLHPAVAARFCGHAWSDLDGPEGWRGGRHLYPFAGRDAGTEGGARPAELAWAETRKAELAVAARRQKKTRMHSETAEADAADPVKEFYTGIEGLGEQLRFLREHGLEPEDIGRRNWVGAEGERSGGGATSGGVRRSPQEHGRAVGSWGLTQALSTKQFQAGLRSDRAGELFRQRAEYLLVDHVVTGRDHRAGGRRGRTPALSRVAAEGVSVLSGRRWKAQRPLRLGLGDRERSAARPAQSHPHGDAEGTEGLAATAGGIGSEDDLGPERALAPWHAGSADTASAGPGRDRAVAVVSVHDEGAGDAEGAAAD